MSNTNTYTIEITLDGIEFKVVATPPYAMSTEDIEALLKYRLAMEIIRKLEYQMAIKRRR